MRTCKLMAALAVVCALSGCSLKEMKSTPFYEGGEVTYVGEASERVNLWPVAYWRNPVGSVIWPVFSFSDDHFAFRPLYSQYKQDGAKGVYDEYNVLWPIAQADTYSKDYRVFPVFWGEADSGGNYQAVFPLYWNGPRYNSLYPLWIYRSNDDEWNFLTFGGLAGAVGTAKDYRSSWCFPLWYENNRGVFVTALFGYSPESLWCFPLWYRDSDRFISLAYSSGRDPCDKVDTWWASPGLLSWGSTDVRRSWTTRRGRILLGLGGWTDRVYDTHASQAWWAWPLVGRTQDAHSTDTWLLSGLVGWESGKDALRESHVYPLYDWEKDDHLLTLLGGSSREDIWLTPLVGIRREKNKHEGGWVFPFWSHKKNRDFDENLARLDRPTLPDCIKVKVETRTNNEAKIEHRLWAKGPKGRDETVWFLLSDNDRSFYTYCWNSYWNAMTNDCGVTFRQKVGNRLLLNYESERKMRYDLKTKAKLSDKEEAEASFLVWLYQYEYDRDRLTDAAYARHRVLWRLWDWEDDDGDVALDVFPGFTYDSRRDGYTKTSLLWRLFRNEYDPKKGRKVDFLFVPVWR